MNDFEWLPVSAADIRTETLESLEEKARLENALCVMAFFLGREQWRLDFATGVIEVVLSGAEGRAHALRGRIGGFWQKAMWTISALCSTESKECDGPEDLHRHPG